MRRLDNASCHVINSVFRENIIKLWSIVTLIRCNEQLTIQFINKIHNFAHSRRFDKNVDPNAVVRDNVANIYPIQSKITSIDLGNWWVEETVCLLHVNEGIYVDDIVRTGWVTVYAPTRVLCWCLFTEWRWLSILVTAISATGLVRNDLFMRTRSAGSQPTLHLTITLRPHNLPFTSIPACFELRIILYLPCNVADSDDILLSW